MNNRLSYDVEINAEPNTKEYSEEIFSKMKDAMKDLTKDFYKKPKVDLRIWHTRGSGYKVVRREILNPRGYYTLKNLKYFKTKEEAEKYLKKKIKNDILPNKSD